MLILTKHPVSIVMLPNNALAPSGPDYYITTNWVMLPITRQPRFIISHHSTNPLPVMLTIPFLMNYILHTIMPLLWYSYDGCYGNYFSWLQVLIRVYFLSSNPLSSLNAPYWPIMITHSTWWGSMTSHYTLVTIPHYLTTRGVATNSLCSLSLSSFITHRPPLHLWCWLFHS